MSKVFKVFLASSGELAEEREAIKELINNYQNVYIKFEIVMWEDMSKSFTPNGIQEDTINPALKDSDIVITLFHSKAGKFTKKEFDIAFDGIMNKTKPNYLFFYYTDIENEKYKISPKDRSLIKEHDEVLELIDYVTEKEQVPQEFDSIEMLKSDIEKQLRLIEKKELKPESEEKTAKKVAEYNEQERVQDIEPKKQKINLHIHSKIPPKDPKFIDRKEDIKEIIESVKKNKECMVYSIKGLGGIGKSAITIEICHIFKSTWDNSNEKEYLKPILGDKKYFQDGILWIRFEEDISFERHIEILSESINYKLEYRNNLDELKNKIEEIFYGNDILIVLDSAEQNKENFTKFYKIFFGLKPVIVTTREKFDFIENVKDLNKLNEDDARELFQEYLSSSLGGKEIQIVDEICKEVDYLPLAIIIMAKMANDISLKEVRDGVNQKLSYKRQMPNYADLKAISIEDVFDISFKPLSDDEKKVLSVASIFNYPFTKESLENLSKKSFEHLKKLVNKSLINSENDGEGGLLYSFHPLMREFALNHFEQLSNKESLKKAKVEYFLNIAHSQQDKLHEHIDEILSILKSCEDNKKLITFVRSLDSWLSDFGYWDDRERLLKEAIKKSKDEFHINHFKVSLGDLYGRQEKLEDAKREFHEALKYFSVDVDSGKYLFIQYFLNTIKHGKKEDKNSYISNSKFLRETLYLNELSTYGGFSKTNGWIARDYQQKDLTIKFGLVNFILDIHNIKDINVMFSFHDILTYLISIEEYQKGEKLIHSLKKHYSEYSDFDGFLQALVNINIEKKEFHNEELLNKCEQDGYKKGAKSTLNDINYLKGKTYLYQNNPLEAKKCFNKLDEENEKNFWLGRCEIESGEFEKAKEHLEKVKYFYIEHENIFERARVDIYLGLIVSHSDIQKANEILSKSKAVFEKFDFTPKEYFEVIQNIDGLEIDTSCIEVETTSFFLENLPSSIQLQDGKEMVLISKGISFYGKGEQIELTVDDIVNDTESFFESDRYDEFKDNIYLYDFYIDKECVTNQEYINYCKSADIKIPSYLLDIKDELLNEPVTNTKLSIEDAKAYAKYYGKELPLPQEWEKAFRGNSGSLYFKNSTNKDLLTSCDMFEITDKHSFSGNENRFRNSSEKYKLIDSFSKNEASKQFIFRCVKPVFSMDDLS